MIILPDDPKKVGLNHPEWREHQKETAEKILNSKKDIVVVQAPTGSGKSSFAAVAGHGESTSRALTHTRNLQIQYAKGYGFEELFGLAAYTCELNPFFQADMCLHQEDMLRCEVAKQCQYLIRRNIVRQANRQSLSYAYYLTSSWPSAEPTDLLFQDEAHYLPSILMSHMTLEFRPKRLHDMGLSMYPQLGDSIPHEIKVRKLLEWGRRVAEELKKEIAWMNKQKKRNPHIVSKLTIFNRFKESLYTSFTAMKEMPDLFYIECNQNNLIVSPMTAAPFYKTAFSGDHKKVLMSATIGNPRTFAGLLGIKDNEYEWINVPSRFSAEEMPVYLFKDAPRMGSKAGDSAVTKQAELMKSIIDKFSPDTHALIHTASKKESQNYAELLARMGYQDRVYVPDEHTSTEQKVADWENELKRKSGVIALSWCFHAGLDAPQVDINIVQKVPFGTLDKRGMAFMKANNKMYRWTAANAVEQGCGRIRRGDEEHYEVPGSSNHNKFVAVIDANISRIKSETSDHFQRCLTYY